jgi:RHS repeat-associated protein
LLTTSITPSGASAFTLGYAGAGQGERTNAGNTAYVNGQPGIQSEQASGTSYPTYYELDASGSLIADVVPDGYGNYTDYYYYFNGQGSVIGLIDAAGDAPSATYSYDPYGAHLSVGGSNSTLAHSQPFRFDAGYYDTATGLYHFGARYYDPSLGRFTQIDPEKHLLDLRQGDPYQYAGDDPINNQDPSGDFSLGDALQITGAAVGIAGAIATGGLGALAIGGVAAGFDIGGGILNGESPGELAVSGGLDLLGGGVGYGVDAIGLAGASGGLLSGTYAGIAAGNAGLVYATER